MSPARWGTRPRSWRAPAVALLLLPLGTCGTCYAYSEWWWTGADAAVRETVASTGAHRTPDGIDARVDSGGALRPSVDFRQPYAVKGVDNFPGGAGLMDFLSPGVWVAHLHFANGHEYHAEAYRSERRWVVTIGPAEGQ